MSRKRKTGSERSEVVQWMSDGKLYEARVKLQGGNRYGTLLPDGTRVWADPQVWMKRGRGWKKVAMSNWDDNARAAVHAATGKILATRAVPDEITMGWVYTVDRNADRDLDQEESRERAGRGAMTAGQIMEETEGASRTSPAPTDDHEKDIEEPTRRYEKPDEIKLPDDYTGAVDHRYAVPGHSPWRARSLSPDEEREQQAEVAALVAQQDAQRARAARDYRIAVATRDFLARECKLDPATLELLRLQGGGERVQEQATRLGLDPQTVRDRVGKAVRRIRVTFPEDADRLIADLQRGGKVPRSKPVPGQVK